VDQVRVEEVNRVLHAWLFALLLLPGAVLAHNPDTSYARCLLATDGIELRLTYDVFTLQMLAPVDADGDQRITREELHRALPAIERFLRAHVHLEIDGQTTDIGEVAEPMWPGETGEGLGAADWHTAAGLITLLFRQPRTQPAREVALRFDFFQTLTSRHTVLGVFEHGAQKEEVTFTEAEPDYLFDATYVPAMTPIPTPLPAPTAPAKRPRYIWLIAVLPLLWWLQRCSGKSRA
jgi:hypothetical protein